MIYTYRLLDYYFSRGITHSDLRPLAPPFLPSYLEYRVHNIGRDAALYPVLGYLRNIARDIASENDALDFHECVHLLCRIIPEAGPERAYAIFLPAAEVRIVYSGTTYSDDQRFSKLCSSIQVSFYSFLADSSTSQHALCCRHRDKHNKHC